MQQVEPVQVLAWAFLTVGCGFVGTIVWAALGIFSRLDRLESLLAAETKELRGLIHDLDKRTLRLEANCQITHAEVRVNHGD